MSKFMGMAEFDPHEVSLACANLIAIYVMNRDEAKKEWIENWISGMNEKWYHRLFGITPKLRTREDAIEAFYKSDGFLELSASDEINIAYGSKITDVMKILNMANSMNMPSGSKMYLTNEAIAIVWPKKTHTA